jgi:hypothetical protein
MGVAKLSYTIKKKVEKKYGKFFFLLSLFTFLFLVVGFLSLKPPEFDDCSKLDSAECLCPKDRSNISRKNIILVDTTDPVRGGKFDDVEQLIKVFAQESKPLFAWVADGKKVDQTSIYLLADKAPADMRPIASFCSLPPDIALFASNLTAKQIRELEKKATDKLKIAFTELSKSVTATSSPIIEALSLITSNATYWNPGSNLILVSDMIQNSSECGWFENLAAAPSFKSIPNSCKSRVDQFVENVLPNKVHPFKTSISVCTLPRTTIKPGLNEFWHSLIQDGLKYDFISTCDPLQIKSRYRDLN